jgi:hypothetical protein
MLVFKPVHASFQITLVSADSDDIRGELTHLAFEAFESSPHIEPKIVDPLIQPIEPCVDTIQPRVDTIQPDEHLLPDRTSLHQSSINALFQSSEPDIHATEPYVYAAQ